MSGNFYDETWQVVELKGRTCLFNDLRIDRQTVPAGLIMYELADDCDGIPCRMRPGILVNFFGTIVTDEAFEPDERDELYLGEEDFFFLDLGNANGKDAKSFLNKIRKGEIA